mgnify:CR=1 FL=1
MYIEDCTFLKVVHSCTWPGAAVNNERLYDHKQEFTITKKMAAACTFYLNALRVGPSLER